MGHKASIEDIKDHYSFHEKLGKGSFATVRRCRRKKDGAEFAVKIIKKSKLKASELKIINEEVEIMHRVNHSNVVRMYEIFESKEKLYIIIELLSGGELFERVVQKRMFSEQEAADVIRSITEALKYLHGVGVVHRDLKPENLMYESKDEDAAVKITDFGLGKLLHDPNGVMTTKCGTPGYVAPEVLTHDSYHLQVDVWSVGVIMYILLCGYPPFYSETNNNKELFNQIKNAKYQFHEKYWKDISPQAKDLIKRCLTIDPQQRITTEQMLEHEWLQRGMQSTRALGADFNERLKMLNARSKFKHCVRIVLALVRFRAAMVPQANNKTKIVISNDS